MQQRYQVQLWLWCGGFWEMKASRNVRSPNAANALADKWNDRHCHVTRYERRGNFVQVVDRKEVFQTIELPAICDVPTVGDVGYW